MTKVTDPASNVTTATYDLRGRRTGMSDPDMGSWSYSYDVLSEMKSLTDAKSQTTTFTYDLLMRPLRRMEPDLTSLWTFDSGGVGGNYGYGRPYRDCNDGACYSGTYQRTFSYNSLGQTSSVAMKVDGTTYTYAMTYEAGSGRVSTVTYPSGFVAKYDYNSYGYLADIRDNATGAAIWTANARNASLQLTQATAGNGVIATAGFDAATGRVLNIRASNDGTDDGSVANLSYDWDAVGNLTERDDTYEGTTEKFCYDALNRLTSSGSGSSCNTGAHTYEVYSPGGNIQRKSDVCTASDCMTYGAGAGPHALTGIAGTVNGIVNPTFSYDANGNMTSGLGRTMSWTASNMVSEVSEGTMAVDWLYGPDRMRYKKCLGGCASPTTLTTYLNGPAYSEKVVSGSTTTWNDYISADGQLVAVRFDSAGTATMRYVVSDHLGSSSVLTDASGAVVERDSYDAWGRRRNPDFTADSQPCSITSQTTRGFTGQEHEDALCLENFNARLYDPLLGRFASADSVVSNPFNGQAFNRYSYATNNPLNATDPSGHMPSCAQTIGCKIYCVSDCRAPGAAGSGSSGAVINIVIDDPSDSAQPPDDTSDSDDPTDDASDATADDGSDSSGGSDDGLSAYSSTVSTGPDGYETTVNTGILAADPAANIPSYFVVLFSETQDMGPYSIFHYQLQNAAHVPLTGPGYTATEHITVVKQLGVNYKITTNPSAVVVKNGEVYDLVGLVSQPGSNVTGELDVNQTFTVYYNGQSYDLTTQFEHQTQIVSGEVTNIVTEVVQ
jgi:RHS repeat-associated protein